MTPAERIEHLVKVLQSNLTEAAKFGVFLVDPEERKAHERMMANQRAALLQAEFLLQAMVPEPAVAGL